MFFGTIAFIIAIICFGMPLAKTLTVNPEYKPLSELNQWQQQNNDLAVYEYSYFTPEMIWDYGKPIPVILNFGEEQLPTEASFGVLVSEGDETRFKNTFATYSIEKVERYDMNPKAPGERSHRPRLWRDLYLVTSIQSR